jgi:hypothetical protein
MWRNFYIQKILYKVISTYTNIFIMKPLHTEAFIQDNFCTDTFYLNIYIYIYRNIYAKNMLYIYIFAQRNLYTETLLDTDMFIHKTFYPQNNFLHTDFFT